LKICTSPNPEANTGHLNHKRHSNADLAVNLYPSVSALALVIIRRGEGSLREKRLMEEVIKTMDQNLWDARTHSQ
jgi:hypothetical protein